MSRSVSGRRLSEATQGFIAASRQTRKPAQGVMAMIAGLQVFWDDMSSCSRRSKKMGTRTIAYQDGQVVFFKAIMDNALGEYLGTGLPDISGKYNDRVARNEGKITGFLDELSGRSAYKTEKGKTVKERVSSQLSVQYRSCLCTHLRHYTDCNCCLCAASELAACCKLECTCVVHASV